MTDFSRTDFSRTISIFCNEMFPTDSTPFVSSLLPCPYIVTVPNIHSDAMFDPSMSALSIILRQGSVSIGLLPAIWDVSEMAKTVSSQIKGYWEAEMNRSTKKSWDAGGGKNIIKSKVYSPLQLLARRCHV